MRRAAVSSGARGHGLGLRNLGLQAKPVIWEASPASVPSSAKWGHSHPLLLRAAAGGGGPKEIKGKSGPL